MFTRIRRLLSRFFNNSRTVNNEPLNKVSLIVIILVDIFILINVFTGLNNISEWHLSPYQAYPCYTEWDNYKTQTTKNKDYEILRNSLPYGSNEQRVRQRYQDVEVGHLGKVSEICLNYGESKDKLNNPQNQKILTTINQTQDKINSLEQANATIRQQYDSTLLEKIAGQSSANSINQVRAEKAKQELAQNSQKISTLKQEINNLQNQLLTKPESIAFLSFLKDETKFNQVKKGYEDASFWYPSIQLFFQSIFLVPLILIALLVNNFSQNKGYGLIALISWHLLVIFLIPLILKIFQFLQIGIIFQFLFDVISSLFGGLIFLISYAYILLIPLIGFGMIKFFQTVVFNPKVQAVSRIQKSRCIRCGKKIRPQDNHCPHCGYYQYVECHNCHNLTYKELPYCHHCGADQHSHTSA
ncbi:MULTISPECIES: hypothetical protein [unclassified Anabaena]|uniref:hypothetical protein n=1 Tax=unclassified Anabaena TaxID=2619674 RepID=UPI001446EBCE|nr:MULTISPECIES: hypothetical protein [unclassified Anabaena]MTJ06518.1 hypothetical protein [Anabaena sp. UHCC 0204]MTJ54291.1 hypothetical protein [Anabaena sp. UHCC 0253]